MLPVCTRFDADHFKPASAYPADGADAPILPIAWLAHPVSEPSIVTPWIENTDFLCDVHIHQPHLQVGVGKYSLQLSHPAKAPFAMVDAHGSEIEGVPPFKTPIELRFLTLSGYSLNINADDTGMAHWFYEEFTQHRYTPESQEITPPGYWAHNLCLSQLSRVNQTEICTSSFGYEGRMVVLNTSDENEHIFLSNVVRELAADGVTSLTISACRPHIDGDTSHTIKDLGDLDIFPNSWSERVPMPAPPVYWH